MDFEKKVIIKTKNKEIEIRDQRIDIIAEKAEKFSDQGFLVAKEDSVQSIDDADIFVENNEIIENGSNTARTGQASAPLFFGSPVF